MTLALVAVFDDWIIGIASEFSDWIGYLAIARPAPLEAAACDARE